MAVNSAIACARECGWVPDDSSPLTSLRGSEMPLLISLEWRVMGGSSKTVLSSKRGSAQVVDKRERSQSAKMTHSSANEILLHEQNDLISFLHSPPSQNWSESTIYGASPFGPLLFLLLLLPLSILKQAHTTVDLCTQLCCAKSCMHVLCCAGHINVFVGCAPVRKTRRGALLGDSQTHLWIDLVTLPSVSPPVLLWLRHTTY